LKAKSVIDNYRAGRAAKGANPLLCATKNPEKTGFFAIFGTFSPIFALLPFASESAIFYPFFAFTPLFTPFYKKSFLQ